MSKALKTGDMVEVYRVPKNCNYWLSGMTERLLNKSGQVDMDNVYLRETVRLHDYLVPRSCVRRVKGEQNGQA